MRPNPTSINIKGPADFYSRTSCEVRRRLWQCCHKCCHFYSRTSCEVRHRRYPGYYHKKFLLTHLLRGATGLRIKICVAILPFLLTHLLRGATHWLQSWNRPHQFLLTHLLRGATLYTEAEANLPGNFYSRTSCEVRPPT